MAVQIALGEKFYLFRHSKGPLDPGTDHLLVSAHGGYRNLFGPFGSRSISVPAWCRLHFYGDHGSSISDPKIYPIMKGEYQVSESVGPGEIVTNYSLSKYQGKHGNISETYQSINSNIDQNMGQLSYQAEQMTTGKANGPGRNFAFNFDVLTIRNRRSRTDPTLRDALNILGQRGFMYENIHCSFCRSKMFGSSPNVQATKFGT